jgi:hypothetical protein
MGQVKWIRHGVLPLLFFAVATLVLTYPLITQLGTHAAGRRTATNSNRCARSGGRRPPWRWASTPPISLCSTTRMDSSARSSGHPGGDSGRLPFAVFASPLTAYNLAFLLSFVLTGWTAYLFCFELTGHPGAALLGGLIVMAFPNRLGHASAAHLGIITNYWRMLYLWALLRVWRGAGWRTAVLGGLCLGLAVGTALPAPVYELIPFTVLFVGGLSWFIAASGGRGWARR